MIKNNKGADQTVQMHRLVYAFVIRMQQTQIFLQRGTYHHGGLIMSSYRNSKQPDAKVVHTKEIRYKLQNKK